MFIVFISADCLHHPPSPAHGVDIKCGITQLTIKLVLKGQSHEIFHLRFFIEQLDQGP
jgi:hypothetical protein